MGLAVEVFSVGRWLTNGDLAVDVDVDFVAFVEHRLIPPGVRCEYAELRARGISPVWRYGGLLIKTLRMLVMRESGSSVSFACRWWEVHSHDGLFYGFQGSDGDVAQLELTNQLFDAVLGEFAVVARQQLVILVGDFNVEPTQIPCLSKGISAGLWVDLEAAWTSVSGVAPVVTCKRSWSSGCGSRMDFMVGCPRAATAVVNCSVDRERWFQLAVKFFSALRDGPVGYTACCLHSSLAWFLATC